MKQKRLEILAISWMIITALIFIYIIFSSFNI